MFEAFWLTKEGRRKENYSLTHFSNVNVLSEQKTCYVLKEEELRKLLLLLIVGSLQAASSAGMIVRLLWVICANI